MAKHKEHQEEAPEKPMEHEAAISTEPTYYSIADEQRRRSEEIQEMGVEAWKEEHDDRPESERAASTKRVPGITHPVTEEVRR